MARWGMGDDTDGAASRFVGGQIYAQRSIAKLAIAQGKIGIDVELKENEIDAKESLNGNVSAFGVGAGADFTSWSKNGG
jgi:hypothetical protein